MKTMNLFGNKNSNSIKLDLVETFKILNCDAIKELLSKNIQEETVECRIQDRHLISVDESGNIVSGFTKFINYDFVLNGITLVHISYHDDIDIKGVCSYFVRPGILFSECPGIFNKVMGLIADSAIKQMKSNIYLFCNDNDEVNIWVRHVGAYKHQNGSYLLTSDRLTLATALYSL